MNPKRPFKSLLRILSGGPGIFVAIVSIIAFSLTVLWLIRSTFDSNNQDIITLYDILSAAILSLLALAVTSYIFLHQELQERKDGYMGYAIKSLFKACQRALTFNSISGLISFLFCIFICEIQDFDKFTMGFSFLVIYISIAALIIFNIKIINHENALYNQAELLLEKDAKALGSSFNWIKVKKDSTELSKFLKECADIQKFLERLSDNHSKQIEGSPEKDKWREILRMKVEESQANDAYDLADKCAHILRYRDLVLVIEELQSSSRLVSIPTELPSSIENRLIKDYLKDELLPNINLSNKVYTNGNFYGSTFLNGLLYQMQFEGPNQILSRISFANARLIEVSFLAEGEVVGANFNNVTFMRVNFSNIDSGAVYKLCNFHNADFSNQPNLEAIDFDSSNFKLANFSGNKSFFLRKVIFSLANCSQAKFTSIQINSCKFTNSNCFNAEFTYSIIQDSDFTFATLKEAMLFQTKIYKTDFSNARLAKANLIEAFIEDCKFDASYCNYVSFQHSKIIGNTTFDHAVLNRADFSHSTLTGNIVFNQSNCADSIFIQANAQNVTFKRNTFINSQLISGEYIECKFELSIFDNSLIKGVRFCKCDFSGTSFRNTLLSEVDFCDCTGLETADFSNATLDTYTKKKLQYCGSHCPSSENMSGNTCTHPVLTIGDAIQRRHSTRSFKNDYCIDDRIISGLLYNGTQAPSAKNRQPWFYTVVNNKKIITNICDCVRKVNASKDSMIDNTISAAQNASTLIIVGYDSNNSSKYDIIPDMQSIGASIENILLSATGMGIQSLWICDFLCAKTQLRKMLKLKHEIVAVIALGKEKKTVVRARKELEKKSTWL